jgi:predicted RNA-binding protein YlxR (DUF448 family)
MHMMGPTSLHEPTPQRTCVGCRRIDAQACLLRAVADAAGRLRFDNGRYRSPGRGATYIAMRPACRWRSVVASSAHCAAVFV